MQPWIPVGYYIVAFTFIRVSAATKRLDVVRNGATVGPAYKRIEGKGSTMFHKIMDLEAISFPIELL